MRRLYSCPLQLPNSAGMPSMAASIRRRSKADVLSCKSLIGEYLLLSVMTLSADFSTRNRRRSNSAGAGYAVRVAIPIHTSSMPAEGCCQPWRLGVGFSVAIFRSKNFARCQIWHKWHRFGTVLHRFDTIWHCASTSRTPFFRGETACVARNVSLCPTFRDRERRLDKSSRQGAKLAKEPSEHSLTQQ